MRTSEGSLTATEERVLRLVSQSNTNGDIASTLGISPATTPGKYSAQITRAKSRRGRDLRRDARGNGDYPCGLAEMSRYEKPLD